MLYKISTFVVAITFAFPSYAVPENDDWQNYLTKGCTPTLSGSMRKMYDEIGFWAHVNVSMGSWAQSMRTNQPEDYCNIDYATSSMTTKRLQCLAYHQEKWDWHNRCKPIVIHACRTAGGYCRLSY